MSNLLPFIYELLELEALTKIVPTGNHSGKRKAKLGSGM
jgi:hypothetical protein